LWLADLLPTILVGGSHISTRNNLVWETKMQFYVLNGRQWIRVKKFKCVVEFTH
jgi:hypothetical protein